jgi:hypothetical protein
MLKIVDFAQLTTTTISQQENAKSVLLAVFLATESALKVSTAQNATAPMSTTSINGSASQTALMGCSSTGINHNVSIVQLANSMIISIKFVVIALVTASRAIETQVRKLRLVLLV